MPAPRPSEPDAAIAATEASDAADCGADAGKETPHGTVPQPEPRHAADARAETPDGTVPQPEPRHAADARAETPHGTVPQPEARHAAARRPGWWARFRQWRRGRPFWGGLLVVLGGAEILAAVWVPLPVMMQVGMQGSIGYLIPFIIVICGALIVFTPGQRMLNSCVAMALGLATWLTSNLGGFFVGMLLTLVGAAMAFAWRPRV
ncbi:DUF6114 domain-containing protein [Allorhizocola rhizosphaerae]|uniref:DUF6114 domain-containing protein n=1 Tax=Allorhizocola rhizosphaerae TaxID=1872709 RepID=UPI001B8A8F39|nr:DUF6114 domain-containing protein [Allorhizocola rhizosphaerae]